MSTIEQGGVVNAAGLGHSTTIAPGSLISIFGTGLASTLAIASSVPLSTTLADVDSVTINGTPAPILYTSAAQLGVIVPYTISGASAQVVVSYGGIASVPFTSAVATADPGIYTIASSGSNFWSASM